MAITSLSTQYISASFQNLVQVSSSAELFNGAGTKLTNLVITNITGSLNGTSTKIPTSAPATPEAGSIYFNTSTGYLYIHNGTAYKSSSFA